MPFKNWLHQIKQLDKKIILEPFSGQNNIPLHLRDSGLTNDFACFDIYPKKSLLDNVEVNLNDSIKHFPGGYKVAVTNPPFLARNSASKNGFRYPRTKYDDIYKLCLDRMLEHCDWVASIVPESFITSNLFTERLHAYVTLTSRMFEKTEFPVGLALFNPEKSDDFMVYRDDNFLGNYSGLKKYNLEDIDIRSIDITFNDPNGKLGLIAVDGLKDKIKFVKGDTINSMDIKHYSRAYSRIIIKWNDENTLFPDEKLVKECNHILKKYRTNTHDAFLTAFKNLGSDGRYRRRLDWDTARRIILMAIKNLKQTK